MASRHSDEVRGRCDKFSFDCAVRIRLQGTRESGYFRAQTVNDRVWTDCSAEWLMAMGRYAIDYCERAVCAFVPVLTRDTILPDL